MIQKFLSTIRQTAALCYNLLLAFLAYFVCRLAYYLENIEYFPDISFDHLGELFYGGARFDLTTLVYFNALYILCIAIPLHYKETSRRFANVAKWIFVVCNSLVIVANLVDSVYFKYTNRRTTATIFQEFQNEDNLASVFGVELLNHWYLVLVGVLLIVALWKLYIRPENVALKPSKAAYYISQTICLLLMVALCIGGARGGFKHSTRPITISNANDYADAPIETAIVLNTPFSIIRTIGKDIFENPNYFADIQEAEAYFTPLHQPADTLASRQKNVVIFILESFSQEFLDRGFAAFTDSLAHEGLSFDIGLANGRKSIDGMPSVLSSIPMFVEPFFLTPASLNEVSGIAGELKKVGYETAFYHGAPNGSMGFSAFAKATGFEYYFGLDEYVDDKSFGGMDDFDGMWAVWDEEFFQFFCKSLGSLKQPFASAMFSASSHHPFAIPEKHQGTFVDEEGGMPLHKCIRYTDYALRRFFEEASKQPWYQNTIFVITADHTNQPQEAYYTTDLGRYLVPIIFYAPDGSLKQRSNVLAQQIDIMPTLLGYLGYDKPYIAFGKDLLQTPDSLSYVYNYQNGIYQFVQGNHLLQFDGKQATAFYDYQSDSLLKNNLLGTFPEKQVQMETTLKAIIQQYMERMNSDNIVVKDESNR